MAAAAAALPTASGASDAPGESSQATQPSIPMHADGRMPPPNSVNQSNSAAV